ncbi:T9SS type A sorting domain-containing protein [Apibacter sp. HY039]|uniref:T9SS type A sorting domain-containing protein n=1 Tax=Apibacter sp. HY039 TaxID=2501476 RepID=UPI000FEC0C6B|nr:T9SS type A sorting domain-containing protein [Apibacter sp. HY039]
MNKANRQLNLLLREYNGLYPSPPCYIGDAGWALLTMNIINPLLAVDETTHKKTDYQISPNPATSRFSILCTNPDKIKKIFLYNQEGKLIKKVNNKSEMEISELESGIYMVQITGDNFERPQSLKLIVQ